MVTETNLNILYSPHAQRTIPKHVPPEDMFNKTIFIEFDLMQLLDIDEKNGIWMARASVFGLYVVPSARWDPELFNNSNHLILPRYSVWNPDIC